MRNHSFKGLTVGFIIIAAMLSVLVYIVLWYDVLPVRNKAGSEETEEIQLPQAELSSDAGSSAPDRVQAPDYPEDVALDMESNGRFSFLSGTKNFTVHAAVGLYQNGSFTYMTDNAGMPYDTENILLDLSYNTEVHFQDGLGVVRGYNGRYGYIDCTGKYVLPPIYRFAGHFSSNGTAVVSLSASSFASYCVIDQNGNPISAFYHDMTVIAGGDNELIYAEKTAFPESGAAEGNKMIMDDSENIWLDGLDEKPDSNAEGGVFIYKKNGKYGIFSIDSKENIIEPEYQYISRDGLLFILRDAYGMFYYDCATDTRYGYLDAGLTERYFLTGPVAQPVDGEGKNLLLNGHGEVLFEAPVIRKLSAGEKEYYLLYDDQKDAEVSAVYRRLVDLEGQVYVEGEIYDCSISSEGRLFYKEGVERTVWIMDMNSGERMETDITDYVHYVDTDLFVAENADRQAGIMDGSLNWVVEPGIFERITCQTDGVFLAVQGGEEIVLFDKTRETVRLDPIKPSNHFERLVDEARSEDLVISTGRSRAIVEGRDLLIKTAPFEKDGVLYMDLYGFRNKTSYCTEYVKKENQTVFTYHLGMLTFTENDKNVLWTKFNTEKRVFEEEIIRMETVFYSDAAGSLPLQFAMETIGKKLVYYDELIVVTDRENYSQPDANTLVYYRERINWEYSLEDFPRIDGSASTYSFSVVLFTSLLNVEPMIAEEYVAHDGTDHAYENLVYGTKDIIFVTQPSEQELSMALDRGVEYELIPFAKEGLVFTVSAENPVESLTVRQIQDIYRGKIQNWKEVGGKDEAITAYQRNQNLSAQTLMETVVMQGLEMTKASGQMTGIGTSYNSEEVIYTVDEYENGPGAIGYSVHYLATGPYARENTKILSVNGIAPVPETIRDETYPFTVNCYMVIRKDSPEDSLERKLAAYVLSAEGQDVVGRSGLTPINERLGMGISNEKNG